MVSFDVTALYTSLPIDRTIQSVREHLEMDDTLGCRTPLSVEVLRLLEICLRPTFSGEVLLPKGWRGNGFTGLGCAGEHLYAEFREEGIKYSW